MTGGYRLRPPKKYKVELDLTADELAVLRLALDEFFHAIGHPPDYYEWNRHILDQTNDVWREALDDAEF